MKISLVDHEGTDKKSIDGGSIIVCLIALKRLFSRGGARSKANSFG